MPRNGLIRLPHVRGGVSGEIARLDRGGQSSPRTWGCFQGIPMVECRQTVFPTYVGVFPMKNLRFAKDESLPHVRGGVSMMGQLAEIQLKSSPRTWGCFRRLNLFPHSDDVFPTYVGVFPPRRGAARTRKGLPHVRGGVSKDLGAEKATVPSSPRTWGCFRPEVPPQALEGVFPTYVGVFLLSI